ncbi:MAG TPA: hypothetical protein PKA49_06860 [Tepidiformaceae bacterium]|nr:hypothetical protein [Thermoflexaceae bacterium]HMS58559.1 hypothetical protein [Tepidiformaceae bacterium]
MGILLDWLVSLAFGTVYGGAVTLIALAAAIPYGAWQGIRWLTRKLPGGSHGDA